MDGKKTKGLLWLQPSCKKVDFLNSMCKKSEIRWFVSQPTHRPYWFYSDLLMIRSPQGKFQGPPGDIHFLSTTQHNTFTSLPGVTLVVWQSSSSSTRQDTVVIVVYSVCTWTMIIVTINIKLYSSAINTRTVAQLNQICFSNVNSECINQQRII